MRAFFSVLLAACFAILHAAEPAKPAPKRSGRLVVGTLKDIVTTNPFVDTRSIDFDVRSLVFEGLTGLDREWNVVPCLAQKWDISPDGLEYVFQLRKGVKFHHGKFLTAEDVKWSIDYVLDPKNRAYASSLLTDVKSIELMDGQTVRFVLKRPYAPFATVLATTRVPIVPKDSTISATAYPHGTGPFRFVEWRAAQQMALRAFRDYWVREVPYVDEVLIKPIPEDNVRVNALRVGDIDLADELPYPVVDQVMAGKLPFRLAELRGGVRRRIRFNNRTEPFSDVRLRQAVAYAIDKAELARGQTWGYASVTNQRFPEFSKWYVDVKDRGMDLKKARSLVEEAGHRDGLKVKVAVYPGPDMELTTILKEQLKRVGIELELVVMDWASHSKVIRTGQFTLYSAGMGGRPDPDQVYYADLHSKSRQNDSGYNSPEVDHLLEKARAVLDFRERKELYRQVVQNLLRDVPEIYLYIGSKFLGVRKGVEGYAPGTTEDRLAYVGGGLAYTWIEP